MKFLHYILALVLAIAVSVGQAEEVDTLPAQRVAMACLENVDAGGYGTSWDDAAELFRKAVTRESWEKTIATLRAPLGQPGPRKLRGVAYTRNPPNVPEGEYVMIQYQAMFGERLVVETVTPMKEADGRWRVSGYFVR